MKFIDLGNAGAFSLRPDLSLEEKAALVKLYKSQVDLGQIEKEYQDLLENGGIPEEILQAELEEIHRQTINQSKP